MRYFCIYEINKKTKESSFVLSFDEAFNEARDYCSAMNNFASGDVYYCVRCLDSFEYKHKKAYNPFFNSLFISSC